MHMLTDINSKEIHYKLPNISYRNISTSEIFTPLNMADARHFHLNNDLLDVLYIKIYHKNSQILKSLCPIFSKHPLRFSEKKSVEKESGKNRRKNPLWICCI